ncbi:hypothetical protein A2313_00635 [Candidatus Roizmanbacteria bacterium RIFOXYB2_FULL_41_10]|uniref:Uncharacterized protein n=1 Tax=Candidatus Roizmanbacteria bacterium RIFOXYA1_FULL_41_12 TaxID=1802082 RepID=A0A1F7KAI7_9BACT|nr:MAG: hypothetical protein A2209_04085 [Candidatus Roizmanbacteria bacterium RIFOXYA1_FULL_41_12]OGK66620.1 MAG: hypothetical protein A2262_04575 [Candidatus Roizmanbacteria bacterium RIFOXYA2_FULL_41_8]OGK66886.1 MAG: hypothetical protein A2377_03240 [Candidatus Roizmanbacteria bacterium RIFOXYB1_FULL_41_27]OGK70740.1 MAG: hypothetical protein A2403_01465 [Candidatus Roizmanbacteria bacterium RIFOXYC1_FULL_41_16]OGK71467.1 MAG: hypothetical protein A2313_00635 [Candidatus Roizmanbacteria bac
MPERFLNKKWKVVNNTKLCGPGCPYECCYCNQELFDRDENGKRNSPYISTKTDAGISVNSKLMVGKTITHRIPDDVLLAELLNFPYYSPETPLLMENFNDPSLDWNHSLKLAAELSNFGHRGEIIYITKGKIAPKYIDRARELVKKGVKLVFIVTYSGLPVAIEPIPAKTRIQSIQRLKAAGLPVIMAMRPMIEGINSNEATINTVLQEAGSYADAITVGGLFVYENTIRNFEQAGHPLDDRYKPDQLTESKIIDDSLRSEIRRVAQSRNLQVPIFDHTSCAVAALSREYYKTNRPDRLAHSIRDNNGGLEHCRQFCPDSQLSCCAKALERPLAEIKSKAEQVLRRLGYPYEIVASNRTGVLYIVNGDLHLSETFFISQETGFHVENLPSYERLSEKTTNALETIGLCGCQFKLILQPNNVWMVILPENQKLISQETIEQLKFHLEKYVRATLNFSLGNVN